jgi:hypothetical protein
LLADAAVGGKFGRRVFTNTCTNVRRVARYAINEALDRATEVEARADAALIKGLMRRTAEDVIVIGQALSRQKSKLGHGHFLKWIDAEFAMSERAARRFMDVASSYVNKSASVADLNLNALYELSAPSTSPEVRAEVERLIAAGEYVRAADIKALKQEAKTSAQRAVDFERKADTLEERNRDLMANTHRAGPNAWVRVLASRMMRASWMALCVRPISEAVGVTSPLEVTPPKSPRLPISPRFCA